MMMQRTFGAVVGLDPVVPTRPHPEDEVVCKDTGETKALRDCILAADGTVFEDHDERFEYDAGLVKVILESHIEWDDEYHQSNDCADNYHFLVGEDSSTISEALTYWADSHTDSDSDDYPLLMREAVCRDILEQLEVKILRGHSTYDAPDITLGDYEVGETEVHVDIANNDVLAALVARGDLESILESLDRDFCISSLSKRVVKGGKFVRWEHDCYVSGGCFTLMNNPDCRYVFGLSDEAMVSIWEEHAAKVDCRLYKVDGEYSAEMFYDVSDDFDSEWIRGEVAKRHDSDGAVFISHHDYVSESIAEHRELLTALAGILEKTSTEYLINGDRNAILAAWAEEALSDVEVDFSDRYPGEDCS